MARRRGKDRRSKDRPTKPPSARPSGKPDLPNEPGGTSPAGAAFPVVGIGASAGGLEALTQLFRALSADTGMAFVVVPHLDPTHGSMLPEILGRATQMPVAEVTDQMPVTPNHVYVIPPGTAMVVSRGILQLSPRHETRGQHHGIDRFLRSLGEDQRHAAIGVILSGGSTDGTSGLQTIKAEGGITFAQNETAQHRTMPQSAVASGCVDFELSPPDIARELIRLSRHPYVVERTEPVPAPDVDRVLEQVRSVTGVDFREYKGNTIYRRIHRRVVLHKLESLAQYATFLKGHPGEVEALHQDILISVTSFFRNPDAFDALKAKVFSRLIKDRSRHEPVRIWVLGCSTGEEAYSIAIALAETQESLGRQVPVQIFATDLNGAGIEKARAGVYPKTIAPDVSPERLRQYFAEVDGSYRISKSIRDMCVFARHNVLTEPPFSRIDLISCRNLLIYLEPALQVRVVPILAYALRPAGYLWLGTSETIGSYRDLFEVEDSKHKIYVKKPGPRLAPPILQSDRPPRGHRAAANGRRREAPAISADVQRAADRVLLTKYVPPSVLINGDMEILQFRGDTGLYLTPPSGRATFNLLKMLREGLLVAVRGAVLRARREEAPVREEGLRVRSNGGFRDVTVHVVPVKAAEAHDEAHYLVMFDEGTALPLTGEPRASSHAKGSPRKLRGGRPARAAVRREAEAVERELVRTKQELAATREYLQSVIAQQEAANEELQSANEEVQSANEELQSINEELETSKEEVQSSNEELSTLNEELHNRNVELSLSNNDFVNLLNSVQIAIVMLGADLRIRRFTPMAEKLFNLIAADVGRPIGNIKLNVDVPELEQLLADVIETVAVKELEVRDRDGRWYSLRLRPYRTVENRIDGAVLVLVDIDGLKQSQEALRRQSELLEQTQEPIMIWELGGVITYWNRGAEVVYGFTKEQAVGRNSHELLHTSPDPRAIDAQLERDGQWAGELTHHGADGREIVIASRMLLVRERERRPVVIATGLQITERKQMEEALRQRAEQLTLADRRKNEFLATLAHELRNPLAPLGNLVGVLRSGNLDAASLDHVTETMSRQLQSLTRLTDDLLDTGRITEGRIILRREPVDAVILVSRAAEAKASLLDARRQQLTVGLPPGPLFIDADAVRIEQVIGNLLDNASKFTPAGGHVSVALERAPAAAPASGPPGSGDEAVIRVRDDGIGIPSETLPRVFDMFVQGDSGRDRLQGGLGIGLTLVRRLVEGHGGTVEAISAGRGQGSEFVVRLPALPARVAAPSVAPEPVTPAIAPRRILVVDDSADGADSLAQLLRFGGHEVRVAYDGPSAVEEATRFGPAVILLDIGMPGMDGLETARRLRRQVGSRRTLLVALSGYGTDADRDEARQAGFDDYLVKPADPAALSAILTQLRPD